MARYDRAATDVCARCQEPVSEGQQLCACGKPTRHMSFAERTQHELAQWRAYRARPSR